VAQGRRQNSEQVWTAEPEVLSPKERPPFSSWILSSVPTDIVAKKNFRTRQDRDQESLLVKQSKGNIVHNPDMGAGTSVNGYNECSNVRGIYGEEVVGGWLNFTLGEVLLFVLTPGIFHHFRCYIVLAIRPKDFKVGLLIKFGSLWHRCLSFPLNKECVLSCFLQDMWPSLQ
jgi:hypothetical protein